MKLPLLVVALLAVPVCAQSPKPVATVGGRPITEADLRARGGAEFEQLESNYRRSRQQLLERYLKDLVEERLLAAEAAAANSTPAAVLDSARPAPVTDADVDRFYEENKARISQPKADIVPQIREFLNKQRAQASRRDLIDRLRQKHKVETLLEPYRINVASAGFPSAGPADAPVTLVEFSDFQCPFCQRFLTTLREIRAKYPTQVRLVYRQFPLDSHSEAFKAAEASLCANEQGKFWELHDAMFADMRGLAVDKLKEKAAGLGLDKSKFAECLDSGRHAAAVKADMQAGQRAGVDGTPASFVNGRMVSGAVGADSIIPIIEDELARARRK